MLSVTVAFQINYSLVDCPYLFTGGQAFTIKLRSTTEKSPSSLLVDPPYGLNGTQVDYNIPPRWRHMKYDIVSHR